MPGPVLAVALFALAPFGGTALGQCAGGQIQALDCNGIPETGCCSNEGHAVWCDGGTLCRNACWSSLCGWDDEQGRYACGGVGPGPGGEPYSCYGYCTPQCEGKECGPDGCGGVCGPCANCLDGTCVWGCVGITTEGCCVGETLYFCNYWNNALDTENCVGSPQCGWNEADLRYSCGTDGAEEPSGLLPKPCSCQPTCDGKQCGPDGCGGSCGTCNSDQACYSGLCCTPNCSGKECGYDGCGGTCGQCEPEAVCIVAGACCVPDCEGKQCGPDGCGGTCGNCPSCLQGQCVTGCPLLSAPCCGGDTLYDCSPGGTLLSWDCASQGPCGWDKALHE
ncbi:MAG: hypothetical protein GXP54_06380, partial [Deltaproteobacteria bacterium]|nr:hypothetical protein [Deltaproteobacteria bacterium]